MESRLGCHCSWEWSEEWGRAWQALLLIVIVTSAAGFVQQMCLSDFPIDVPFWFLVPALFDNLTVFLMCAPLSDGVVWGERLRNVHQTSAGVFSLSLFLGPRGPLVLPSVGPVPSVPSAIKIWITYIQAYMPYESWKDSSNQPYGPMGSLGCPLDPLGPPGNPPIDPLRPINRSLGLIALLRSPQLPHKSHSP